MLFHSALDSSAIFFVVLFPQQATVTAAQLDAAYETRVWLGLAIVAVVALTRGRLSYKPAVIQEALAVTPK